MNLEVIYLKYYSMKNTAKKIDRNSAAYEILKPTDEALALVPGHMDAAGIDRQVWLSDKLGGFDPLQIAIHTISNIDQARDDYCSLDTHDYDEINLLMNADDQHPLTFSFEIDNDAFELTAPATIVIPAGVAHKAKAISGAGQLVCIRLTGRGTYKKKD